MSTYYYNLLVLPNGPDYYIYSLHREYVSIWSFCLMFLPTTFIYCSQYFPKRHGWIVQSTLQKNLELWRMSCVSVNCDKERLYVCRENTSSPCMGEAEWKDSYLSQRRETSLLKSWLTTQPSLTLPISRWVAPVIYFPDWWLFTNYYLH